MIPRAWMIWGVLAILAGSTGVRAKPPESPVPMVDGTATPIVTQNYYQPEPGPSPRLLPSPVIVSAAPPLPIKRDPNENAKAVDLQLPAVWPPDLDKPIRETIFGRSNWQAETAFAIAELNLEAGDIEEAHRWYEEVIKQAPGSFRANDASERIERTKPRSK
jgi:hypothetical protein